MTAAPGYPACIAVLVLASLSVGTTMLGVAVALRIGRSGVAVTAGIGFSAGIMLLVSFFELVPEAIAEAAPLPSAAAFVLGGLLVALLHWTIPHTRLVRERGLLPEGLVRTACLVAFGLILHDGPEGFAMAVPFAAGAMVFVSVHELIPMARRHHRMRFFGLGALLSVGVYLLLAAPIPGWPPAASVRSVPGRAPCRIPWRGRSGSRPSGWPVQGAIDVPGSLLGPLPAGQGWDDCRGEVAGR